MIACVDLMINALFNGEEVVAGKSRYDYVEVDGQHYAVPKNPLKVDQTIHDILVGHDCHPHDSAYTYEFFIVTKHKDVLLHFALNVRATFRWVPVPDAELKIKAGEVLAMRYMSGNSANLEKPVLCTRGFEALTRRIIVDQSIYED